MPRPVQPENTEDLMDDESYEEWETISEGFGTKIEWTVGKKFIGEYIGVKDVPLDDKDDGFSTAPAAQFHATSGEKFYCWLPYSLKEVIDNGTLTEGRTVMIHCTGESPTKRGLNPVKTFTVKLKPV
jgi:hypothetical protein